ncbi:putative pyruvate, phosphate dikinase regulatory protein [Paenibacillus sp. J31TS4]|uniref:pyruvate, water dikinase regulatory protein n=1 Tax=Paenibacillus sp. J31TS4 TaxID=2807195 RepID=UPI001B180ECE|nr:pyruvate, water dikinase regulatory protein [Paenibacillus sp. J31TS4]GIP39622.1 putative pyruvate, phosphate dikinase regulatory protein [Paenibacillus sp. J31TS4]
MNDNMRSPAVFVVSDSAGDTAESVVKAAIVQFSPIKIEIRRHTYVNDRQSIDMIVKAAKQAAGVIVFTLVIPELRDYLLEQTVIHQVVTIDLLGPIIGSLENVLHQPARHQPGMIHHLDEDYFRKVEAIEFAVKYDDGKDARGIHKSDIVLVGVSRTSKTPLSMYLANKKFKVANVPLVPELKAPDELFTVARSKIIGLTISPDKLNMIRKERLRALGLADNASYANVNRINQELAYSETIMKRLGCVVIDVSNKAVEETASQIQDIMRSRK